MASGEVGPQQDLLCGEPGDGGKAKVRATTGEGLDLLRPLLKNKVSVFYGASGAGKSTILNSKHWRLPRTSRSR